MASYSTNEFKSGLKVMLDNDPCAILENEFVKPGKGQAFNRVKFRNPKSGRVWERTFKSGESSRPADVMETDMQFLYSDGRIGILCERMEAMNKSRRTGGGGETRYWLKEEDSYQVTLWNEQPCSYSA
ncbi:MAG: hypothetical protein Ct9H90mP27_3270 [Gammaproteobacteria bacterium]|nr:MAG: hypothetical protein Ct9H90mP27_3270 [Gammaproteobacteria bacterium]